MPTASRTSCRRSRPSSTGLLALTIDLQNVLFTAFEQLLTARIEGAIASGTYDVGLETLRAESFVVTDRRAIYTHPGTGAETRLLTITQRERNRPVTLDDALDRLSDRRAVLLINERSGRAAVQVPAPSLMLDDGEIERRVRLIRPMEQHSVPLKMMAESHWVEADRERFAAAWQAELAEVPEFTDSTIHVVAGLAAADLEAAAERVDARLSASDRCRRAHHRPQGFAGLGRDTLLAATRPTLTPDAAFAALIEGRTVLDLAEGLQLRRVRVMGAHRIELSGFTDTHARSPAGLRPLRGDHLLEAAHVRADRRDGVGVLAEGARTLSGRAHRRTGGRVMPRDASELARRLAREAEAVCRHYLSNGRREGRYWLVGDVHNTPGRSMFVRL